MTIKDIAKKCGVGVSTVSRAMNNHPDINQETKDKILRVIAESNYIPNNSARNLKRSEAKAIAVLVKGLGNTFFGELVSGLERECEKKGYSCILQHVKRKNRAVRDSLCPQYHLYIWRAGTELRNGICR